jgi:hypothetical protein
MPLSLLMVILMEGASSNHKGGVEIIRLMGIMPHTLGVIRRAP